MSEGRKLDALIAEKVFGYTLDYEFADMMFDGAPCVKELRDGNDEWGILPSYSSDMGDAWLVVARFIPRDGWVQEQYNARRLFWDAMRDGPRSPLWAWPADKAATIICRAALEALGVEV